MTPLGMEESRELAEWLRLIAQPQRLMILSLLLQGSYAVSEIELKTGITQPTLSQHLGTLRRAGLVDAQRESRAIHYAFSEAPDAARARALLLALRPDMEGPEPIPRTIPAPASPPTAMRRRIGEGAAFARILPKRVR